MWDKIPGKDKTNRKPKVHLYPQKRILSGLRNIQAYYYIIDALALNHKSDPRRLRPTVILYNKVNENRSAYYILLVEKLTEAG